MSNPCTGAPTAPPPQQPVTDAAPVLFSTLGAGAFRIGLASLNRPRQLNVVNLEMVRQLSAQLRQWRSDQSIAAVILRGEGDRAFCAGGDVAEVVRHARALPQHAARFAYGDAFFEEEYLLDRFVHHFGKPFVVFSHGVNMGGGLGLSQGASHRIVAEVAKLAMPEIQIGLFPDVGAGHFLHRLPPGVGLAMAMSGLTLNEADALDVGLFHAFLPRSLWDSAIDRLASAVFSRNWEKNHATVTAWMQASALQSRGALGRGEILARRSALREIGLSTSPEGVVKAFEDAAREDRWFEAPLHSLSTGSALSAKVIFRFLRITPRLSLDEVFALDTVLARQFLRREDFPEGVRALLIDKDRKPRWKYTTLAQIPESEVRAHFAAIDSDDPCETG
jgi:enoyl-CoA hydratase/carnithine racemase